MITNEYGALGDMFESTDEQDIELASAIFCNMTIDEATQFLTEWGAKKGTYHNSLPPKVWEHLLKINNKY